ncbi:MAG: hypothetical protein JNK89_06890, partial [Saprospiraceae bacterium]|nr:hypothetical protein [Saprospiraceae bacterium]
MTLRIMVLPLLLLLNCTPETPTPPEPPANPSKLEIVWQTPMGSDSLDYFSIQPLFFNDKVVFSQADFRQNKEVLRAFDRYTGAPAWNWEPVFAPDFIPSMNGTAQAGGKIA